MTILIGNVATTDTFQKLLTTVNQLASAVSNSIVTVGSNAAVGDASVTGNVYSNSVVTNNISVVNSISIGNTITIGNSVSNVSINTNSIFLGNSTTNATINTTSISFANSTANLSLKIPTASQVSNGQYFLNANGTYAPVILQTSISNVQITTTGVGTALIDSWPMATYNSAEYLLSVNDNNSNNHYGSKIMIVHNTTTAFITEYASYTSNSYVGVFSTLTSGTNVLLYFTPISSNTTVKFARVIV